MGVKHAKWMFYPHGKRPSAAIPDLIFIPRPLSIFRPPQNLAFWPFASSGNRINLLCGASRFHAAPPRRACSPGDELAGLRAWMRLPRAIKWRKTETATPSEGSTCRSERRSECSVCVTERESVNRGHTKRRIQAGGPIDIKTAPGREAGRRVGMARGAPWGWYGGVRTTTGRIRCRWRPPARGLCTSGIPLRYSSCNPEDPSRCRARRPACRRSYGPQRKWRTRR